MQKFAHQVIRKWDKIAPNGSSSAVNSRELLGVLRGVRGVRVGHRSFLKGFSALVDHERGVSGLPEHSPVTSECVSLVALNHALKQVFPKDAEKRGVVLNLAHGQAVPPSYHDILADLDDARISSENMRDVKRAYLDFFINVLTPLSQGIRDERTRSAVQDFYTQLPATEDRGFRGMQSAARSFEQFNPRGLDRAVTAAVVSASSGVISPTRPSKRDDYIRLLTKHFVAASRRHTRLLGFQ